MKRFVWMVGLALLSTGALAHKASDSYMTLSRSGDHGERITGRFDIALRDLDNAITLDADGDGQITWGEVRRKRAAIIAYALSRLSIASGGVPCTLEATRLLIDEHSDGHYAVLTLDGRCPAPAPVLAIDYRLLFDIDPQHRGLLNYVDGGLSRSVVFGVDQPHQVVGGDHVSLWSQFATYVHEGIRHIWGGYDHILFLLSLLLPAVLTRRDGLWRPAASFRAAFVDVAKVVTAFTLAHSITLTLATLGLVAIPSRLIESAIALSVVLAALNNVFPIVAHGRWMAAFGFGLLHGFGFAGALQDLGLPTGSLALSLAGFNVGVEIGQFAIVMVFLPVAYAVRASLAYRRVVMGAGSMLIAVIAAIWMIERAFNVALFAPLLARA